MNSKRIMFSFAFKFFERIMIKGLGLVVSIVLARLIAPEIYGLIAIVMVFISLAQTFVESGLATALVQNENTSDADYSTVFHLSMLIAMLAIIVLYFAAPMIAYLYDSSELITPLRVLSLSLIMGALNSVQIAKLQREMRFREMMICNLVAAIFAGASGIWAAISGLGLWALVIQHMVHVASSTVALTMASKWFPKFVFSMNRAKILYGYGWKLLVSALLSSAYNEVRTLVVGYRYSSTELAYYNKGYQFPNIIANTLDVSIQSVMLPVMSREQDQKVLLRKMLIHTLTLSVFIITPIMMGLAAVANTLVPFLLGEVWKPCIPLLWVFCVSELMLPILSSNLSLLKAIGKSDLYMKTEFVRRIIMLAILILTVVLFDSVMAIACGYAISSWLDTYIISIAVKSQIDYSWTQQVRTVWKSLLSGAIMFCIVHAINGLAMPPILTLSLQIGIGAIVYIGISVLLKNEAMVFMVKKIRKLKPE